MNTWQLAEDFRALFEADATFAGNNFYAGQDASTFEAPALVFSCTEQPMNGGGSVAMFTLTVQVHGLSSVSDAVPNPDQAHADTVQAVETKLLRAGKAALLAALNALGRWNIRGWGAGNADPTTAGMRFLTPVIITGTVLEI